jgi:hypothetical protein
MSHLIFIVYLLRNCYVTVANYQLAINYLQATKNRPDWAVFCGGHEAIMNP